MRKSPAGTAEAMTAKPAAQAADMSGAQRSTEVRAGAQISAAHPATEVAATHPAQVRPAHSAAEMTTTHSTAEMTAATATTTTTAATRPCVGRDAGACHRYGHGDHRDFVQRKYPHDISFRSTLVAPAVRSRVAERRRRERPIDHPARHLLDLVTAFSRLRRSGPQFLV
jgi:hypothetical protein